MEPINRRLLITGRVQGVWYRKSAVAKGTELGLVGTARNLADGTVEVEAEGDPSAMEQFIAWCRNGPPLAQVEQVTVESGPIKGFDFFSVIDRGPPVPDRD